MKNLTLKSMLIATLLLFQQAAMAEDIDLFMGFAPSETDRPNVMIILDNAANFSATGAGASSTCTIGGFTNSLSGTTGGVEQCALYKVISELEVPVVAGVDKPLLNIGMMVYNANGIRDINYSIIGHPEYNNANCSGTVGGCLVVPLMEMTSANKTKLLAWIRSWNTSGTTSTPGYIKASGQATAAAMQETWAYYAGLRGLSGRPYAAIKPPVGCQKNYVIFVGNSYTSSGTPGDSAPGGRGPENALNRTGLSGTNTEMYASPAATSTEKVLTTVPTSCGSYTFKSPAHESNGFYADEWARYLLEQSIITYTIGVIKIPGCKAEYAALLTNMAGLGGGKYYPTTSYDDLVLAFTQIFSEIQSVDSVFASVSLPASVGTQGTFLNQIYIGMFRPDADAKPRWLGNLKQYKLGLVNNELKLVYDLTDNDTDSTNDISAINTTTGFVTPCARSYWSPSSPDSYWALKPQGDCLGVPNSSATAVQLKASNYPDGPIVEKGAQGYRLRNTAPSARTVYTCSPTFSSCTSLTNFNTGNGAITAALLGATDATQKDLIINWARGENNKSEDLGLSTTTMRRDAHGDVVHSRPVAINYGTADTPDVVVFYSANDGMLRAIKGNRTYGDNTQGNELWSFIPPEFWVKPSTATGKLKRIYDNTVAVTFPGPGANPKPYAIDGPIAAFKGTIDIAGTPTPKTFIYASMRRGGRAIYALDVTDQTSPTLKWKIGCPNAADDTGCTVAPTTSGDISGIGQTWSSPSVITATGYDSGNSPMLILGGGYDPCEDTDNGTVNHSCTPSTKGNKVYVLDANTGAILKTLDTVRSVPAGITVASNSDGDAQYAYTVDTGGNIYRITMLSAAPADWTITKIASVGCDTPTTCSANRKFLFAPDVVFDPATTTYHILIGSGDREKPLTTYTATSAVDNFFFMIKDRPTQGTWLSSENGNCGVDVICLASLTPILTSTTPSDATLSASKGWYLGMLSSEQTVTSAITISNVVSFSTHQPSTPDPDTCSTNLGEARVYNINFRNAKSANNTLDGSRYEDIAGDGLPPPPVGGEVTLDTGETVPFCIGCDPDSPLEGGTPPGTASWIQPKSRVYWYIQQ